jgi:hypothetical protein
MEVMVMTKVHFDVKLNKKETKYLTPEGKEVERVSTYKKMLGDTWSKYSIGLYKGRDNAYNLLKQNSYYLENEESFKKAFNSENKKTKEKALERGTLYHEEIEEAFKEEDYKGELEKLADRTIDGEDASNPFAKMLLEFMKNNPDYEFYASELSFVYEDKDIAFGGTIDLVFNKCGSNNIVTETVVFDFKTSKQTKEERAKYPDTVLEYALQQVAYRFPLQLGDEIILDSYKALIFWEDGEITTLNESILDSLQPLFLAGIKYQEELKKADKLIKDLLSENNDDELSL